MLFMNDGAKQKKVTIFLTLRIFTAIARTWNFNF
jgi:hypothetical protein